MQIKSTHIIPVYVDRRKRRKILIMINKWMKETLLYEVTVSNTKFKLEKKQNGMDFQGSPYVLFVTLSCSLQMKKLINVLVIQMWLFKVYHTFVVVYSVKVHIIYIYVYHFFSSTKYLIICSNYCTMWFENWNSNLQMSF